MNFNPDLTVFDDAAYAGLLANSLIEEGLPVGLVLLLVQESVPERKVPQHLREPLDIAMPGFCDALESDMNSPESWEAAREIHSQLVASGALQNPTTTDTVH